MGAVIRLGGVANHHAVFAEAGYSDDVYNRGVRHLIRFGCLVRPFQGTLILTDRGAIAYALYQGKERACYERRCR